MRSIRSKDTKLERNLYSTLSSEGVEGLDIHPSDVYGKPDFVHRKAKIAVFLDGCFWHGCPEHCRMPHSNVNYWEQKIERNKKRDVFVTQRLEENGWLVLRIWEHSLSKENDLEEWSEKISNLISERQRHSSLV
jgi:DNA mismatch endonuclease (patch repair protein)